MGKVANGRLGLVAVAASALGLVPTACNHAARTDRSGIDLTVTVPADVKVRELTFQVTGNGIKPMVGRWMAAEPQHQFEQLITRIPPGDDYNLAVVAKSVDTKSTCNGQIMVSVAKDAITRAHVALSCHGGDGSVVISVGVGCTKVQLATFTVSPLAASVGETITLSATPLVDGGALEFLWTAASGTFEDPEAQETTYRCTKPGHIKLNLLVVARDICQENHDIDVDCLGAADAGAKDAPGG